MTLTYSCKSCGKLQEHTSKQITNIFDNNFRNFCPSWERCKSWNPKWKEACKTCRSPCKISIQLQNRPQYSQERASLQLEARSSLEGVLHPKRRTLLQEKRIPSPMNHIPRSALRPAARSSCRVYIPDSPAAMLNSTRTVLIWKRKREHGARLDRCNPWHENV